MNVARLNTAHMTHDDAKMVIDNIRAVSDKIGILLDTKGPEIRTSRAREALKVRYGDAVRINAEPGKISCDDII